jgi:predicted TIM-barrel enzyme
MMGGRSLRATAEVIYGSSGVGGPYDNPTVDILATVAELERLETLVGSGIEGNSKNSLFEEVGGFAVWNRLLGNLNDLVTKTQTREA